MAYAIIKKGKMIQKKLSGIVTIIIWLLPVVYLISIYNTIPQTVPMHFGIDGKADRFGSKQELVWTVIALSAVAAGIYLLIRFLPRIDPKKQPAILPVLLKNFLLH